MSDREMHFPPISGYPKQSDTAIAVDAVEAWLDQFPHKRAENKPNGGIIRSVADTSRLDPVSYTHLTLPTIYSV